MSQPHSSYEAILPVEGTTSSFWITGHCSLHSLRCIMSGSSFPFRPVLHLGSQLILQPPLVDGLDMFRLLYMARCTIDIS